MGFFPAEHSIQKCQLFQDYLKKAILFARQGDLFTFGVVPVNAETGYGYIKVDKVSSAVAVQVL